MKYDNRLSSVLDTLLPKAEQCGPVTSEVLAQCLDTNPVVVSCSMGLVRQAGQVTSGRGVTLRQLHEALGGPGMFAVGSRNERPECLVGQSVNTALVDAFAETEALLLERLSTITPSTLAADFAQRHAKCQASKGQT